MSISDELEKLAKMKAEGLMTEDEFAKAKAKLLAGDEENATAAAAEAAADPSPAATPPAAPLPAAGAGAAPAPASPAVQRAPVDPNQWSMFIHLSSLAMLLAPILGAVAPIVLWQIKKDESEVIDRHGKMVSNWAISVSIYWAVALVASFVLIGLIFIPVLYILTAVFGIVGSLKANNGEYWPYPLTIAFLK